MELFEGNLDLLLEDISLLKKELNSKGKRKNEEVIEAIVLKEIIYKKISGSCLEDNESIFFRFGVSQRKFLERVRKDFISKKKNYKLFAKSILPILESKYDKIFAFKEQRNLTKLDMANLMKEYMSKEHSGYYQFFLEFLKSGRLFSIDMENDAVYTICDRVFNRHNVVINNNYKNDVTYMKDLIHEFGHVVDGTTLSSLIDYDIGSSEILSIKWEREFLSFLLENKIQLETAYTELSEWYHGCFKAFLFQEYLCEIPKRYLRKEKYRYWEDNPIYFNKLVCDRKNYEVPKSHINHIICYPYAMAISGSLMALRHDDRDKYIYLQGQIEKERLENKKIHIDDYLDIMDFNIPEYVSRDLDILIQGSKEVKAKRFLKR